MNILVSKRSWLLAPAVFLLTVLLLTAVWTVMEPQALRAAFDADGRSFFETLTLPFYALIAPLVWLCCPFSGSVKRQALLCAGVSCVALMAVVKELDRHPVRGEVPCACLFCAFLRGLCGTARVFLSAAGKGFLSVSPGGMDDVLLWRVRRDGAALRPSAGLVPTCEGIAEIRSGRFVHGVLHGV